MTAHDCIRLTENLLEGYPVRTFANKDEGRTLVFKPVLGRV